MAMSGGVAGQHIDGSNFRQQQQQQQKQQPQRARRSKKEKGAEEMSLYMAERLGLWLLFSACCFPAAMPTFECRKNKRQIRRIKLGNNNKNDKMKIKIENKLELDELEKKKHRRRVLRWGVPDRRYPEHHSV